MMAALSEDDIIRIIKNGPRRHSRFRETNFSDDQALDVAMYIRTLTFALRRLPPRRRLQQLPVSTAIPFHG